VCKKNYEKLSIFPTVMDEIKRSAFKANERSELRSGL
jgi:hypothetical protein